MLTVITTVTVVGKRIADLTLGLLQFCVCRCISFLSIFSFILWKWMRNYGVE